MMSISRLYRLMGKHSCCLRLIILLSGLVLGYLLSVFLVSDKTSESSNGFSLYTQIDNNFNHRTLLSFNGSNYPTDIFSVADRRKGAVILHVSGMVYMFVALAIVCDEFFVPSLGVITETLKISEDVAGATFMAAGGSAPELFTNLIGVFISKTDVGIGTIVGSAVFNILFVIGMCAVFSKELLKLTWWPLFRDVTFYSFDLILLIVFFVDDKIQWWESLVLLSCYFIYVTFMKFNVHIETALKNCLKRTSLNKVASADNLLNRITNRRCSQPILHSGSRYRQGVLQLMISTLDPLGEEYNSLKMKKQSSQLKTICESEETETSTKESSEEKKLTKQKSSAGSHSKNISETRSLETETSTKESSEEKTLTQQKSSAGSHSKNISETRSSGSDTEKALQLHAAAAASKQKHKEETDSNSQSNGYQPSSVTIQVISNGNVESPKSSQRTVSPTYSQKTQDTFIDNRNRNTSTSLGNVTNQNISANSFSANGEENSLSNERPELEEESEPLDLSWPDTIRKQITYILVAPIMFPLWITLPDVRVPEKRKYFVVTFLGSIMWIAGFSYLMVWWANQTGETIGIQPEVMGLTILAAGTSIPDLITSVIVAKKGYGDMAVSSSVGSNIFDITVGLPLPWIIFTAINTGEPYSVTSDGLLCSIVLLFLMLLILIITIASSKWKLSKTLGGCMFLFYFVFVALSVLLEFQIIVCPRV